MRARVGIGSEDRVVLPPREAEALGVADGEEIEVHTSRGGFTLVAPARGPRQAYFAGSLAAVSVAEALNFVLSALRTGVLLLSFASGRERESGSFPEAAALRRRSVYFRDGQVVFASSSDRADRLGAVLWRNGILPLEDLERSSRLVRGGRPLGQVLVDEGLLTAGQLYSGMTLQVREIVLAALLETRGEFTFLEGPHDERNAVKLPERTKDLLLTGMKRSEEVELLSARLPDVESPLRPTGRAAPGLDPWAERLLACADGERTGRKAFEEAQLDRYSGLRALDELARQGLVEGAPPAPPRPAEEEVFSVTAAPPAARASGPFDTYRRIFKHVYGVLRGVEGDARRRVNSYFERLPETQRPLFEGVRVEGGGEVDVAQVLVNVGQMGTWKGAAARARALEALEDFLAFLLFEVKNCLPRAEADAVLREVGRMQVGKS